MRTNIKHFIPCACSYGGLCVNGIYIEEDEEYISIMHAHAYGIAWPCGIWNRIKNAWFILWGSTIFGDDSLLSKEGVEQLRNACQDALDRWPSDNDEMEAIGSLNEVYVSMVDEESGRKMRLESEDK